MVLVVNVRANARCPETTGSLMMVTFGATSVAGGDCDSQSNSSEMIISSGESVSFYADTDTISLTSDETFCFIVSVDKVPGESKSEVDSVINIIFLSYIWNNSKG